MEIAHIHIELDIDPPLLYLGRASSPSYRIDS